MKVANNLFPHEIVGLVSDSEKVGLGSIKTPVTHRRLRYDSRPTRSREGLGMVSGMISRSNCCRVGVG